MDRTSADGTFVPRKIAGLRIMGLAMTDEPEKKAVISALLAQHGRSYACELGIDISRNTPSALFRLLCASILFSARIKASVAVKAARAFFGQDWTTAKKMAESTWEQRVRVLNQAGYARYDESTSRMLGETADLLLTAYGGDLRCLREKAGRQPEEERRLLKEFKGLGNVGVDIFFREVQLVWNELYPFADAKAMQAARRLGLGDDVHQIAHLVDRADFNRLLAALVRVSLSGGYQKIKAQAQALA
jgi:hypothetical protein